MCGCLFGGVFLLRASGSHKRKRYYHSPNITTLMKNYLHKYINKCRERYIDINIEKRRGEEHPKKKKIIIRLFLSFF